MPFIPSLAWSPDEVAQAVAAQATPVPPAPETDPDPDDPIYGILTPEGDE